jgi:glycosyltransferase involved in cell wall biosynthesis
MDMPNFALALHLADCGVSVELVAHRIDDALAKHSEVNFHRVPKPLNSYLLGSPLLDFTGRRAAKRSMSHGGRAIVNGGNCQVADVNWVHYVHAAYAPTFAGSLPRRAKAVLSRRLDLEQERRALGMSSLVIANSERTRRDLVERLRIRDSRIHTVYYGIDSERFQPPTAARRRELREQFGWPDRPQVAFIGALGDRRKGFDTLFAAWARLCRKPTWDCDLVVVGRGAELAVWEERARSSGLAYRMRFLGFRKDVPNVLSACDALVAPTRYEAFGLGVQEALCAGLPALVSASAGVAERYPSELATLLLRDPESVPGLEASLTNWRSDHEHLRERTLEFSARLRQRTWSTMAREIKALLDRR